MSSVNELIHSESNSFKSTNQSTTSLITITNRLLAPLEEKRGPASVFSVKLSSAPFFRSLRSAYQDEWRQPVKKKARPATLAVSVDPTACYIRKTAPERPLRTSNIPRGFHHPNPPPPNFLSQIQSHWKKNRPLESLKLLEPRLDGWNWQ